MTSDSVSDEPANSDLDSLFGGEGDGEIDFDDLFSTEEPLPSQQHVPDSSSAAVDSDSPSSSAASSVTICPYQENPQYGLRWERESFWLTPIWTVEPTIVSIIQVLREKMGTDYDYHVKYWRSGPYNKFYRVYCAESRWVMKVTLPICPRLKTQSEVATLNWVRTHTQLPVPRVLCYDATRNNPVGFEWILMERVEGRPLSKCWERITEGSLKRIVRDIAHYAATAFHWPFRGGIGNIYRYPSPDGDEDMCDENGDLPDPQLGEMVWMPFFWGERGYLDYPRGPFRDTHTWNESRLRFAYSNLATDMQFMRRGLDQKEDWRLGTRMLKLINRVRRLGPRLYPGQPGPATNKEHDKDETSPPAADPEPTMLWHDNLSLDNIFVDENFVLTGILDWECVSCLPRHAACDLPAFLQMRGAPDTELPHAEPAMENYLDKGEGFPGLTAFYRDRRQYVASAGRRMFLEMMELHAPGWCEVYRKSADQRDLEAAIQHCDNEFAFRRVGKWVDALERGKEPGEISPRLHKQLYFD